MSDETRVYLTQYKDWSGEWCDHGAVYGTAREARDACIASLASLGYSDVDVRVLRRTTTGTLEVVTVPQ